MALNKTQQFQELINQADNILLCWRQDYSPDAVAAALALARFLKFQDKRFKLVMADFKISPELAWLPGVTEIENQLKNLRQFVISIDLQNKKISEFSYDIKDKELEIYILPEEGDFQESDIKTQSADYFFDLIITLDTPDLEALGNLYFNNPEFWFETPIINIDHNVHNENYGQLNLVDLTATATTEILYNLIKDLDEKLIDEEVATLLLTGMIGKTGSFKTKNVTPKTLQAASDLINKGAQREKIVSQLYHTKTLPTLKLWGRVLARLQHDRGLKLVWSVVPQTDFVKAGAVEEDIKGVVEEMINNSPQAELVLLLYESQDKIVFGEFHTIENYDARWLLNLLPVVGTKNFVSFKVNDKTLNEVEVQAIGEIRKKLDRDN